MPKVKVGEVYGNVTVIEIKKYSICKDRCRNRIKYRCSCGKTNEIREDCFIKYKTKCKCERISEFDKMIGQNILNITVLQKISNDVKNPKYRCICNSCKEYKTITYQTLKNKRGKFRGCACPSLNIRSVQNYVYTAYKIGAKKRNKIFDISFDDFIELCEKPCFYCGKEKSNISNPHNYKASWSYNGLDRKDNNIGYITSNIAPSCKLCNKMKMALDYHEFIDHIYNIRDHLESKKCQNTT